MKIEHNKRSIRYLILIALISLTPLPLFSQSTNKQYYNFKTFTTADGISSNKVTCMFKDSRGFLWVGTDRGLQRYNGSDFLTFRRISKDSNSIANETVLSISEDKEHNIWIGTLDGITRFSYSNGTLSNFIYGFKNGNRINLGSVYSLFEDSQGRRWMGTLTTGLYLFDKIKQQWIHYSPEANLDLRDDSFKWVTGIQETDRHEIIFSVRNGFVLLNKEGRQQYVQMPKPKNKKSNYEPCSVLPLLKEYPDEIWLIAGFNGLFKYNRSLKRWTNYLSGNQIVFERVQAITNWSKNEWLLGFHNLCFFNHRTGVFTKAFDEKRISNIADIHRDNEDNVWMASNTGGLHLLNLSKQLFSSTQSIAGWNTDMIIHSDEHLQTLYGISPYNASSILSWHAATNTISRHTIPYFLKNNKVLNNFIADNNVLYLAMHGGMWMFNLKSHKLDSIVFKNASFSSQQGIFFDVCKSHGNIYFAGRYGSGGPYKYDKTTDIVRDLALISKNKNGTQYHSYSLAFSGNILFASMTTGDSIYCYNEATGKQMSIAIPDHYTNGKPAIITSLCTDKQQNLWCGAANNGIYIFNIPTRKWIRHISQQDGYFATTTSQIVCDDDGVVWTNSSEGLYAFNTTNFRFKNYTLRDGLLNESEGGNLAVIPGHQLAYNNLPGDNISFGLINTKPVDTGSRKIQISITNLQVLGKDFLKDTLLDNIGQVIFPPNHNAFSLSYAGVTLTEGKNLLYSYKLDGAEEQWHEAGNTQTLSYINLHPGKYLLHIRCNTRDDEIAGEERLLHIRVLPAWHQTWGFKLLSIMAFSTLLFFAIRYHYKQQIKKQQNILERERALTEERNRIAADMHDDVGAGLSRIRYITSSIQSNNLVNDNDIRKIVSLSDEAVEKMNEIIWALNQGNQQLEELIYYSRSQCSEMLNIAGISFRFDLPEQIPAKTIGWKDCRNIYLLLKEAVNNAIKHAEASSVSIECSITNHLHFIIIDNGIGFDPDLVKPGGNGLLNLKKRVESLNGIYHLTTSAGQGTKIVFILPIRPGS